MLTITENNLRPGTVVELDGRIRTVKRIVRHPAGAIVQWHGRGDFPTTHNSVEYVLAAGPVIIRP